MSRNEIDGETRRELTGALVRCMSKGGEERVREAERFVDRMIGVVAEIAQRPVEPSAIPHVDCSVEPSCDHRWFDRHELAVCHHCLTGLTMQGAVNRLNAALERNAILTRTIQKLLASGHPSDRDHPTMSAAWREADAVLQKRDLL